MSYTAGIDLGGTNIAVGIVDEAFRIVSRAKRKTALPRSGEAILQDAEMCIRDSHHRWHIGQNMNAREITQPGELGVDIRCTVSVVLFGKLIHFVLFP